MIRISRVVVGLTAILLLATWGVPAQGAPGSVLWEARAHPTGFEAIASNVAVEGSVVVSSGWIEESDSSFDWLVRAHDSTTGRLLWQDQFDQAANQDFAMGSAINEGRTFVAGITSGSTGVDWLVRAYDTRRGRLIWQDRFDNAGLFDAARGIAVDAMRVFVAGQTAPNTRFRDRAVLVRAYDQTTGSLLWQTSDPALPGGAFYSLAVDGGRLFVASTTLHKGHLNSDSHIRAYDTATGALLWEDQPDRRLQEGAFMIAARDGTVLSSHIFCDPGFEDCDYLVRANDAVTGALLWEDLLDNLRWDSFAGAVEVGPEGAFVGGSAGEGCVIFQSPCDLLVRSYDLRSGDVLWEDLRATPDDEFTQAMSLDGGRLYVGVQVSTADAVFGRTDVPVLDAASGSLLTDDLAPAPDDGFLWDIAVKAGRVFYSGFGEHNADAGFHLDFVVRALAAVESSGASLAGYDSAASSGTPAGATLRPFTAARWYSQTFQ